MIYSALGQSLDGDFYSWVFSIKIKHGHLSAQASGVIVFDKPGIDESVIGCFEAWDGVPHRVDGLSIQKNVTSALADSHGPDSTKAGFTAFFAAVLYALVAFALAIRPPRVITERFGDSFWSGRGRMMVTVSMMGFRPLH